MPHASPIPESTRIPGVYQFRELLRSAGLATLPARICMVGPRETGLPTTFDDVATLVANRGDSQEKYGSGSVLDLMIRSGFATGVFAREQTPIGGIPQIWAVSTPPPAGVKAVYTITITGAPTSVGKLTAFFSEEQVTIETLTTDTVTTLATRLKEAYDLVSPDVHLVGSSAIGVATFTAREFGEHGNDILVHADVTNAPGVSVVIAQSVVGTGVVSLATALAASLTERFNSVAVAQSDATTLTDVAAHIVDAHQFDEDRERVLYLGHDGDWSDATTSAATLDDYRIAVVSAEKIAGAGPPPFDFDNSSRSMAAQAAGAVAAMMSSQSKPSFNHNLEPIPAFGRPNWARLSLNSAIGAGVLAVAVVDGVTVIVDPVSSAVTDQTGQTTAPDTRWQPLEIPKTIREISQQMRLVLARFAKADETPNTLARAKGQALVILRLAASDLNRWVKNITDDSVTVLFDTVGGRTDLVMNLIYSVVVGVDAVAVTHQVTR